MCIALSLPFIVITRIRTLRKKKIAQFSSIEEMIDFSSDSEFGSIVREIRNHNYVMRASSQIVNGLIHEKEFSMKKSSFYCWRVLGALCLLLSAPVVGSAYESNGATSFFGEYEVIQEDEDTLDKDDRDRETTDNDRDPSNNNERPVPEAGSQQINQDKQQVLPATGAQSYLIIQTNGVILLVAGIAILKRRSENEKKSSNFRTDSM